MEWRQQFSDSKWWPGIQVFANSKAWFASGIVFQWLKFNFAFNTKPVLLLLDELTGHQTVEVAEVAEAAKSLNVHIMSIHLGLTSIAQPADISWNKPFKAIMRQKWTNKLIVDLKNKTINSAQLHHLENI